MGDKSKIEWTEATWNPTLGCNRVSPGCVHCYAEVMAARIANAAQAALREGKKLTATQEAYRQVVRWQRGKKSPADDGDQALPAWNGNVEVVPEKLDDPLRWARPRMVFVNSMSDLFHERLSNEDIAAVFGVMAAASQHTFQVLTKRPERALEWLRWAESPGGMQDSIPPVWPLPNVWLGVSVEDQATADERIPLLLQTPAAVRFVSYEPALGPVDWEQIAPVDDYCVTPLDTPDPDHRLHWIIVGGESGPDARPFDLAWARLTLEQCRAAGVPVFVKQLGGRPLEIPVGTGRKYDVDTPLGMQGACAELAYLLEGTREWKLHDRKGGDPAEWPEDLRVRQFPSPSPDSRGASDG